RRLELAVRQVDLAANVGISPSYLNLIEHNRRRIGGKLLIDLARELDVDPALLSEGAQRALLGALGDAAAGYPSIETEADRVGDFAGRFPGWATLIAAQHHRNETLEHVAEALSDRLTHDPQLAASLHEVLSVATAIRATASILADGQQVDPEWQARFQRNLFEDAQRLAQSAQALVQFLDASDADPTGGRAALPQEALETWLQTRGFYIAELEGRNPDSIDAILRRASSLSASGTTARFARDYLVSYRADAQRIPAASLSRSLARHGLDPLALAGEFDCDLATILRRLACRRDETGAAPVGLVSCDNSGTFTFRKPIDGFALPRFGAACALWPLYQALSRPMSPIRAQLEQSGHRPLRFLTYAISQPRPQSDFDTPQIFEATMLILPDEQIEQADRPARPVGSSCRICPRNACAARREPSIINDGF
ncbi:MAG: short-chain fatty acyl-CoA regulator family protein, partial [Paracoccaceae bacterium]